MPDLRNQVTSSQPHAIIPRRHPNADEGSWEAWPDMKFRIWIIVLFLFSLTSLASADSRSATIRVSCTILPALQVSSSPASQNFGSPWLPTQSTAVAPRSELTFAAQNNQIYVSSNLDGHYRVNQTLLRNDLTATKLYSVTAL